MSNFIKICPVEARDVLCGRTKTDSRTDTWRS